MGLWDFHLTADDCWQWRHVSEGDSDCVFSGHFPSRNDCIADAMRHGYLSEPASLLRDADRPAHQQELHADSAVTPFLHRLLNC